MPDSSLPLLRPGRPQSGERLFCPVRPYPTTTSHGRPGRRRGASLIEVLAVCALACLVLALAVPVAMDMKAHAGAKAAAREFANLFAGLRYRAVSESRHFGVHFEESEDGWRYSVYRDAQGNGLHLRDIRDGREERLEGPWLIRSRWSGVVLKVPEGKGPPPSRADLSGGDPVRFGRSDVVSFTPLGTATSGTLYLAHGGRHWAVVLYGPSVRIRLWERRPEAWVRRR